MEVQPRLVSWYGPCDYSYSSYYCSVLDIQVKVGGEWKYQPPGVLVQSLRLLLLRLILFCGEYSEKVGGEWKYQPRLVSWYGPCNYSYSG